MKNSSVYSGVCNFIFFVYDTANALMQPQYEYISDNQFKLNFTSAKKGKVVIPFKYGFADEFVDGVARVMEGSEMIHIDVSGKKVAEN